jgi:hypothetical protein
MVAAQASKANVTVSDNSQAQQSSITVEPTQGGGFTATAVRIEGASPSRIADDGNVDFAGSVSAMQTNIGRIQSSLDERTYDPKTGEARYVVPEGSRERALLQQQATSARQSLDYQVTRLEAIKAQRDSDAQSQPAHDPRSLAAFMANGNPAKAQQILQALERQDADALALTIRNHRDGK